MFKSARLKLTVFYLASIVIITLAASLGTRWLAENAVHNSDVDSRNGLRDLFLRDVGLPPPSSSVSNFQDAEESKIQRQLNEYVVYVNIIAFVVGGIASYWFASRTLKPIEEAHAAQSRFASDASHELRTPLTVMRTENEVFLRQNEHSTDEAVDQIKSNLEEVERLEQLSSNLLTLAKYEQGDKLALKRLSSSDIADSALNNFKKLHPADARKVEVSVAGAHVEGNQDSLAQVLVIFLDNAVKYTPAEKRIKLVGKKFDGFYRFMVEDNGPGIPEDDMPLIFDRLYRSDKNRNKAIPGYGLGLSLAKEIAKANGAGLSVSNIKGGGARFTLSLSLF